MKKNEELIVEIIDNGISGEGIAKVDGIPVFIPNVIKGEKVRIKILKVLKSYAFGKAIEILQESLARVDIDCETYSRCGGCNLRHCDYKATMEMKKNSVQNTLSKALGRKIINQFKNHSLDSFPLNEIGPSFNINDKPTKEVNSLSKVPIST